MYQSVIRYFTPNEISGKRLHENSQSDPQGIAQVDRRQHATGLQPAVADKLRADKLRKIISFLQEMEHEDALRSIAVWKDHHWKDHQLTGNQKGVWSLFVTKNWRITFSIDKGEIEIIDLNYEDYH